MSTIKKHSKYKNTGILFELLVRQVTSDMMSNQDSKAVSIIKKFFKGTEMSKEYGLYNTIINAPKLSEGKAESLINVVLEQGKKLQRDKLNKEKKKFNTAAVITTGSALLGLASQTKSLFKKD